MGHKRHRYTRDWTGWKCSKCAVAAFPTLQRFYRHWERAHLDAESSCSGSDDGSVPSSGSGDMSGNSVSGAGHSNCGGTLPGDDPRSETRSDQPCGLSHGADGLEAQQDDVVDAAASEQAMAPGLDVHPGTAVGDTQVPEQLDGDLFYDAVCRAPPGCCSTCMHLLPTNVLHIHTAWYRAMCV